MTNSNNYSAPLSHDSALAGKVALVTGGGSGLGEAICQVLAEAGAHVMVADINADKAASVAIGLDTQHVIADVGNAESAEHAISKTIHHFGKLDILVNNAGVDVTCSLEELSIPDWERVVRTNLSGPFLMSRFAARHFRTKGGGGHIVNIASTAAKRNWPNASAYHASKWGLLGLSHALHAELRPHHIKVTAVIAGGMRTPFLLDRFPDIDPSTLQDPRNVAMAVKSALLLPEESVIPEIMVLPMRETSWP